MLERAGKLAVRRPRLLLACWVVLALAGGFASRNIDGLLSTSLAVPATTSQRAVTLLGEHFGADPEGSFTVIVPTRPHHALPVARLRRQLAVAARSLPGASVGEVLVGAGFEYASLDTPLSLQAATGRTPALRAALARAGLGAALVTGPPALQHDLTPVLQSDLRRGGAIALGVALVVLVAALGFSPAVLVPFVVAGGSVLLVLGVLDALARVTLLVLYVPNLVELIGLGLGFDYGLLVLRRFREELVARPPPVYAVACRAAACDADRPAVEAAVLATMATAGRAVAVSGGAVAVGLCVLLAIPVPFVRSLGLAGLLVPVASVLSALTLLPALLVLLGRRALPAKGFAGVGERADPAGRLWSRLAGLVGRHRPAAAVASLALVAGMAVPACWLRLTPVSLTAIPGASESARGLLLLTSSIGPGSVSPIEVVLDTGAAGGARRPAAEAATLRLVRELMSQPAVLGVAIGTRPPYLDATGRYEQVIVVAREDLGAPSTRGLVVTLRDRLVAQAHFGPGARSYVGGAPAQGVDFLDRVYSDVPLLAAAVAAATYLVLALAFGSLLLPLVAMLLDACSVAAAYGLLVVVFRFGLGADLFGLYRVGRIEGWVPVLCFAILFGLSMDYEVFLVSRVGELVRAGESADAAVAEGLARTGRVVSAAALIMVGALGGLVAGHVAGLQELGVGLALGVAVDATLVRSLLLPAVLGMCGRAGWWLPTLLRPGAAPGAPGPRAP